MLRFRAFWCAALVATGDEDLAGTKLSATSAPTRPTRSPQCQENSPLSLIGMHSKVQPSFIWMIRFDKHSFWLKLLSSWKSKGRHFRTPNLCGILALLHYKLKNNLSKQLHIIICEEKSHRHRKTFSNHFKALGNADKWQGIDMYITPNLRSNRPK